MNLKVFYPVWLAGLHTLQCKRTCFNVLNLLEFFMMSVQKHLQNLKEGSITSIECGCNSFKEDGLIQPNSKGDGGPQDIHREINNTETKTFVLRKYGVLQLSYAPTLTAIVFQIVSCICFVLFLPCYFPNMVLIVHFPCGVFNRLGLF